MNEIKLWQPSDTHHWVSENKYQIYTQLPTFELEITNDVLIDAKNYVKHETLRKYTIIIKLYKNNVSTLLGTTINFYDGILSGIYYKLYDNIKDKKSDTVWDIFGDDLIGVKCKIVAIYKGSVVGKALTIIKENLSKNNNICTDTKNKVNKSKIDVFDKFINVDIDAQPYYVYQIYDVNNESNKYICGSFQKYNLSDVNTIIDNFNLNINEPAFDLIEEVLARIETEGLMYVDKYITQYNTINNGFNLFLNLHEDKYFISIQKDIMNMVYIDTNDYSNGIIASIEYDSKLYIFKCFGYDTIKSHLNYLYSLKINTCETKYKSIVELINKVNFTDLSIRVLERNIKPELINSKFEYYINNYDTYDKGYNVVNNLDCITDKVNDICKKTYLNTISIMKNNQYKTFYKKN